MLLALALLGAVAAFSVPSQYQYQDQQLRYRFKSSVHSGIPELDNQYAGFRLKGQFVSQSSSSGVTKIQLQDLKFNNVNGHLQEDFDNHDLTINDYDPKFEAGQETEVPSEMKQHLETPFKVIYDQNGKVQEVKVESDEPVMITNIKKSLVTHQNLKWQHGTRMVDTNQIQRQNRNINDDKQPTSSFKTMEKMVHGECEVIYTVNKLPEYLIEEFESRQQNIEASKICQDQEYYKVDKQVNYEKCEQRPIYQRTVGARSKSDKTEGSSTPYIKEAAHSESYWCGSLDKPILRKQYSGQDVYVSGNGRFDSEEKLTVYSEMTIELIKVESKTEMSELSSPKSIKDLSFSYPKGDFFTSEQSASSEDQKDQHLPQPDLTSAPVNPYPRIGSESEAKDKFVDTFVRMVEVSKQSPESSSKHEDVVNQAAHLSLWISGMSYDDINDCWSRAHSKLSHEISSLQYLETSLNVFCDILSMASTNPSVKFISEKLKNGQLKGESGAWIAANMIRSVRTPTEEVIQELTSLLKHDNIQKDRTLRATIALTLTEMIHKACVDETTSQFNFPTKVYGKFCSQKSKVIRKDLIPFLQEKLYELKEELKQEQPSSNTMNKMRTYIGALGNLGMEEATQYLLEIIEGRLTSHSQPRSLAVYHLMRTASRNPTKYRPVILALIQNSVENDEVRMAAVTGLQYCEPTSKDLKKIAALTWSDSSKQVSSYISATLKTLKDLPIESTSYKPQISQMAEEALKIAKPFHYGMEKSQNLEIQHYLESLKASVGLKMQYINPEESAIPRQMYIKSEMNSQVQHTNKLEASLYVQGADQVIEKLQDLYKAMFQQESLQQQKQPESLQYKSRSSKNPEAHVVLKMFDMQRYFTVDAELLKEVLADLTKEMHQESDSNGIKRDYLKVLDLTNHLSVIPTSCGLPLYIKHVTPLIMSSHTSIVTGRDQAIEIKSKPVFNYMQQTSIGTFCPFTKQYLGTGVESALHASMPIRADIGLKNGQLSINLRTPQDQESQKNKPVLQLKVTPYTIRTHITKHIHEQKQQIKTIYSKGEQYKVKLKMIK